jgi:ribosome-interacting GTPase 1
LTVLSCFSKLARLRAQLLEPTPGAGSGGGSGFDVSKSGDARIALVGFPSVGKSTFLSKITKTKSEVAAYSFTTLTAIPGVLEYGGAEIQILDLPGIIEGASEGKGRGRQVISAAKVRFITIFYQSPSCPTFPCKGLALRGPVQPTNHPPSLIKAIPRPPT